MTRYIGFTRAGVCAAVLVGLCAVAVPAHGLSLLPRYASPTGSGTDCTQASPCGIVEAINNAPSGDEVIIESGVYGSPGSPVTTQLTDSATASLNIHGQTGAASPLVYSAASDEAVFLGNGSTLSHFSVVYSGSSGAVLVIGGDADHVVAVATGNSSYACGVFGDLSDSLCVDSGTDGAAVEVEVGGGEQNAALDSDTAIAANAGIMAVTGSAGQLTVNATDTIVRGTVADVVASADSGCVTEVHFAHSAYRPGHVTATGPGPATVFNDEANTAADPTFVHPGTGDFREAAGSPTIDGGAQAIGTSTDLAGNPRTLGSTTDIGAYEFVPKPAVGKINVSHTTSHSVTVTARVNPERLATTVQLIARHGHGRKTSHGVSAGNGSGNKSITLTLGGLRPGTTYHLVAKATNQGGTTRSAAKSVTTKAKPKPKHHHHHHHSRA